MQYYIDNLAREMEQPIDMSKGELALDESTSSEEFNQHDIRSPSPPILTKVKINYKKKKSLLKSL